jgi:membrane associated rhomboid family serine protease
MFVFIPYEIETLVQERPWANGLMIAVCTVVSLAALWGGISKDAVETLVLAGWTFPGLLGHILLHSNLSHLLGNMLFLWVFGNAICTNIGNLLYIPIFLACALIAAIVHLLADGSPAIGASGAINGIVGLVLAMYPLNRVHVFWIIFIRSGSFSCPAWSIILFWFAFDIWGVASEGDHIAYWAHIGGLLGGVGCGMLCLHLGWFQLTEYDNRSLLQILRNEPEDS